MTTTSEPLSSEIVAQRQAAMKLAARLGEYKFIPGRETRSAFYRWLALVFDPQDLADRCEVMTRDVGRAPRHKSPFDPEDHAKRIVKFAERRLQWFQKGMKGEAPSIVDSNSGVDLLLYLKTGTTLEQWYDMQVSTLAEAMLRTDDCESFATMIPKQWLGSLQDVTKRVEKGQKDTLSYLKEIDATPWDVAKTYIQTNIQWMLEAEIREVFCEFCGMPLPVELACRYATDELRCPYDSEIDLEDDATDDATDDVADDEGVVI